MNDASALAMEIEWEDIELIEDVDAEEVSRETIIPQIDLQKLAREVGEATVQLTHTELERLVSQMTVSDPLSVSGEHHAEAAFEDEQAMLALEEKYEEVLGLAHRMVVPRLPPDDGTPRPSMSSAEARVYCVADGCSSIAAVVARSGLPRPEALASLCELYQRKIVDLVEP